MIILDLTMYTPDNYYYNINLTESKIQRLKSTQHIIGAY